MLLLMSVLSVLGIGNSDQFATSASTLNGNSFGGRVRILCTEQSIGIELANPESREGRLYARRMSADPNCVQYYKSSEKIVHLEIPFNYLPCGVKSRRMTHPRPGLEYSVTVILGMDKNQMTEDDEMFSLSCRYYANHKDVATVMEVSTFAKSFLVGGRNGPSCDYTLHYGSLNGPPAENARIGDKVFHEWKCADSGFALKVYDCYVHDGANRRYKLIDEHGCSKDKTIIPDLTYDPQLNFAFAPSRVFKFAESTKMFFNCLLYMCPKSDPACRRAVPPDCSKRERRSVGNLSEIHLNVKTELSPQKRSIADQRAILSAPVIEFQPVERRSIDCPFKGSMKAVVVALLICNLVTMTAATVAIAALCRRHHSARLVLNKL